MVDMYAWGAYAERCGGSSPPSGTIRKSQKSSFVKMGFFIWIGDLNPNWFLWIPWMGFIFNEERRVAAGGATKSPLGHHQKIRKLFTIVKGFSFAKSLLFPILTPMQTINVKVCTGRSCSERQSGYINTRLDADREFYGYWDDEVVIETCMCQGRCKEGPTVVFGADIQIWQNPVKASELLRKKVTEARKRINNKK